MRQQNVARLAGHLDHAQLDVVRGFAAFNESLNTSSGSVPRTQIPDPRISANERVARVRRLELLHSFDFAETLNQPVRPLDKKSAAASLRKLRKACKEAHAKETAD